MTQMEAEDETDTKVVYVYETTTCGSWYERIYHKKAFITKSGSMFVAV